MEYLKKFKITDEQIADLKDRYNTGIINYITENEVAITEIINYLYSEDINCIFLLMLNNIQIFLETKVYLKNKINEWKEKGYSNKAICMLLLEEN